MHGAIGQGFGDVAQGAEAGDVAMQSVTFEWNPTWILENSTVVAVLTDSDGYVLNYLEIHPGE